MARASSVGVGPAGRFSSPALFRFRASATSPTAVASVSPMAENRTPGKQAARFHPSLNVIGGGFEKFSPAFKSNLQQPYRPCPVIGSNRHIETIFAAFFRSLPDVRFRRECIRTKDDGAVALDWVAGDDRNLAPLSPVLILLVSSGNF
uniref:Alcohol O-acetyltransferase n=1 Tax=Opuntia streptacantha TaxID=393608 RepID=A0A7C9DIP1_OPUST